MVPRRIASALTPWFAKTAREMSWRGKIDPYEIWVSEVMLQQTRVDTVERHFSGFIRKFPNVQRLAAASEDAVLAAWS
jgi:A/G-specific adenine glycosylase